MFSHIIKTEKGEQDVQMKNRGMDAFLEDMFSMEKDDENAPVEGPSEIAQFFAGRKVLVTGASGFLGKLLVEKILRSCGDLDTLYLFMRSKKGKTSQERFNEHFDDVLYGRLKKEKPHFKKKVILIEADTSLENLGLSSENRERLKDTEIIFHCAAMVHFEGKLRSVTNINVKGTKQLLLFAREMPNIKAFIYVSTAFSYCVSDVIEEKCYEPPMSCDKLVTLTEILNDEQLEQITSHLIGKWPNTYAYTKAIAEDAVRKYSNGIPSCIVRPSIMMSTSMEPIRGWINNLYGPTGVTVGVALGLLRTIHCDGNKIADVMPADYAINNIIVAAWHTAQERTNIERSISDVVDENQPPPNEEVAVYNIVSGNENPITWGRSIRYNLEYGEHFPSIHCMWYYVLLLNSNKTMNDICECVLHLLPALIVDIAVCFVGKKPFLLKGYKKIHKFSKLISYFAKREWKFVNDKNMALWDKLSPVDKYIFNFNVKNLDWSEFHATYIAGVRLYIAKEPMDTLDKAATKFRRLKIIHYTVLTVIVLLLCWAMYSLFYPLYSWIFSS